MSADTIVVLKTLNEIPRTDLNSLFAQYVPIAVAFAGILYAARQLRANATSALLQAEVMLFDNQRRITNASAEIISFEAKALFLPKTTDDEKKAIKLKIKALTMKKQSAIENYLSSLDRFCACILRGVVPRRKTKREYQVILNNAVYYFRRNVPNFEEHFPNLMLLRRKWNVWYISD